jgi:hypothetical protein
VVGACQENRINQTRDENRRVQVVSRVKRSSKHIQGAFEMCYFVIWTALMRMMMKREDHSMWLGLHVCFNKIAKQKFLTSFVLKEDGKNNVSVQCTSKF